MIFRKELTIECFTHFLFDVVGPETICMVRNDARLLSLGGAFLGRLTSLMG